MADPKAATAVYVNHVPVHKGKEASIQKAFELFNQYVYAKQKVPGLMDEARLAELQKFYVTNGVVPKETPLKDLYTNQFVTAK
jgi:NitT/TauT family transport system substrate-binding protein